MTHHPGFELYGQIDHLTITEAARRLDVSRSRLSEVCHGHRPISAELATKLELAGLRSATYWLIRQARYDAHAAAEQPFTGTVQGLLTDRPPEVAR